MSEYIVIYEASVPSGYAIGGNTHNHMRIDSAKSAKDAVRQAVEVYDSWVDGSLWAVPSSYLEKVEVERAYEFRVGNSS